jgi:hypothetical protein
MAAVAANPFGALEVEIARSPRTPRAPRAPKKRVINSEAKAIALDAMCPCLWCALEGADRCPPAVSRAPTPESTEIVELTVSPPSEFLDDLCAKGRPGASFEELLANAIAEKLGLACSPALCVLA